MENLSLAEMVENIEKVGEDAVEKKKEEKKNLHENEKPDQIDRKVIINVGVTSFGPWFETNKPNFSNIRQVNVSEIKGIDSKNILVFNVPKNENTEDRTLEIYKDVEDRIVLDLPGQSMKVLSSGCIIQQSFSENIILKSYGVSNGLHVSCMVKISGDLVVPYSILRVKRGDKGTKVPDVDVNMIKKRLLETVDMKELIEIYYRQAKSVQLTTKEEAVRWLIGRQLGVVDINHLIQVDRAIVGILN